MVLFMVRLLPRGQVRPVLPATLERGLPPPGDRGTHRRPGSGTRPFIPNRRQRRLWRRDQHVSQTRAVALRGVRQLGVVAVVIGGAGRDRRLPARAAPPRSGGSTVAARHRGDDRDPPRRCGRRLLTVARDARAGRRAHRREQRLHGPLRHLRGGRDPRRPGLRPGRPGG